jgi:hypothetical protein
LYGISEMLNTVTGNSTVSIYYTLSKLIWRKKAVGKGPETPRVIPLPYAYYVDDEKRKMNGLLTSSTNEDAGLCKYVHTPEAHSLGSKSLFTIAQLEEDYAESRWGSR